MSQHGLEFDKFVTPKGKRGEVAKRIYSRSSNSQKTALRSLIEEVLEKIPPTDIWEMKR